MAANGEDRAAASAVAGGKVKQESDRKSQRENSVITHPPPATGDEAFEYILSFLNIERGTYEPRAFRLDRMERLVEQFGRPHQRRPSIHLAGSKGKGSTAAFISRALTAAGYRTGTYGSPHVEHFTERITIDGAPAPEELIVEATRSIHAYCNDVAKKPDAPEQLPTTFELLTLLAFLVFDAADCDWMVVETGLGGRLDATNVLTPRCSVITPIEREHTEYLGTDIRQIAWEKAGIFKTGVPAVVAPQHPEVTEVLEQTAADRGVPVTFMERAVHGLAVEESTTGTEVYFRNPKLQDSSRREDPDPQRGAGFRCSLRMLGQPQAENAVLAYLALRTVFPSLPDATIAQAFGDTRLPGRMEVIPTLPPVVLDTAHTPQSARRLAETVCRSFPKPVAVVVGLVDGKDYAGVAEALAPLAGSVVVTRAGTFKPSYPERVATAFRAVPGAPAVQEIPEPADALARAREQAGKTGTVLVCGSFYLVGEVRAAAYAAVE